MQPCPGARLGINRKPDTRASEEGRKTIFRPSSFLSAFADYWVLVRVLTPQMLLVARGAANVQLTPSSEN